MLTSVSLPVILLPFPRSGRRYGARRLDIDDSVEPAAGPSVDSIVSEAAAHGVESRIAHQGVVAVRAADHVRAGAAVDRVVSLQAIDDVAAGGPTSVSFPGVPRIVGVSPRQVGAGC